MKVRPRALVGALAVTGCLLFASQGRAAGVNIPINFTDPTLGSFSGNFNVTKFINQGGTLAAVGTLTGTVTDAAGTVLGTVSQALTLPLSSAQVQGDCTILHLVLGPLDLNLLGLMVHLDQVVLDITAQPGPGNLLGNLLCAVANLLNGNNLNGLLGLLNNILRHLP